jgi:hypothetical protein
MVVIDNVPTGLAIGRGGRVGRVMSGRILDGGSRKGCFTDVRSRRSGIGRYWSRGRPYDGLGIIASLRLISH